MTAPKSILFVTVGNRDVQLRRNLPGDFHVEQRKLEGFVSKREGFLSFIRRSATKKNTVSGIKSTLKNPTGKGLDVEIWDDSLIIKSPREGGEVIWKNPEIFDPVLLFPMVGPVLEWFKNENAGQFPEKIIWVYTDQNTSVAPRFRNSDTLFFAKILDKWAIREYPGLKGGFLPVTHDVKNVDVQYRTLGEEIKKVLGKKWVEAEKVFVLPQGGIDGINQALTLQLIQLFKDRLVQLAKPESEVPALQDFPQLFLRDLAREKVLRHLELYDFGAAADLFLSKEDMEMKDLCTFAHLKLHLHYDEIKKDSNLQKFAEVYGPERFDDFEKLTDLWYEIKIHFLRKNYGMAIGRLYNLYENLFRLIIERHTDTPIMSSYFQAERYTSDLEFEPWINFLTEKFGEETVQDLRNFMVNNKPVRLSNPNTPTFTFLTRRLAERGDYTLLTPEQIARLEKWLKGFGAKRNKFMHGLDRISQKDFREVVSAKNHDEFFSILDKATGAQGLGPYEKIKKQIEAYYGV